MIAQADMRCVPLFGLLCLLAAPVVARDHLTADALLSGKITGMVPTRFLAPVSRSDEAPETLNGKVSLTFSEPTEFGLLLDRFGSAGKSSLDLKRLPSVEVELISDGNRLFPLPRTPIHSDHPYWEFVFTPGKIWREAGDGGYSRASLPVALQEKNANCLHNGILTFLYDGQRISKSYLQIGSETCKYLQFDLAAVADTKLELLDAAALPEQAAENGLPVASLQDFNRRLPQVNTKKLFAPNDKPLSSTSTAGLLIDGTHYSAGCPTRYGPYPFCESLVLPSYSAAKAVFGGGALMALEKQHPGNAELALKKVLPDCGPGEKWDGVTLEHLADMNTGIYKSAAYMADEDSEETWEFLLSTTSAEKRRFACERFPRKQEPGKQWTYHTSDTFLLGLAMSEILRKENNENLFDFFRKSILNPAGVSATANYSRHTLDAKKQPFVGWGLNWLSDDVVKLATFLNNPQNNYLQPQMLQAALQRDPSDRGPQPMQHFRYKYGFWALEASRYFSDCDSPLWIPFMSGFGGVTVLLLPNQVIYYSFSDGDHFRWMEAAQEIHRVRSLCPKDVPTASLSQQT